MNIDAMKTKLQDEANRCVGKVMGQLDIIQAPDETKRVVRRAIWDFKNDIADELAKHGQEGSQV